MRDSKKHSRGLVVTLLDLKNAFGEVNHNLIRTALAFHHVPDSFVQLFNSIYSEASTSVSINSKRTKNIPVNRGVLQGDPCSPLLFNLCFNTLMLTLNKPELNKLGTIWGPKKSLFQCSWLQFADDAAIISNSVKNTQQVLDIFKAWCEWSGMIIRLDKCCTFGMLKIDGRYEQYEPAIFLDHGRIPTVAIGSSFTYLGKLFNFEMKKKEAKEQLLTRVKKLLKITSDLPIRPQMKLLIMKRFVYSNLVDDLKKYAFGATWIRQNLDSEFCSHVRDWLGLPPSACLKEVLTLSKTKCGFGIPSIEEISEKLKIKRRFKLKNSDNKEFHQIWQDTTNLNALLDRIVCDNETIQGATRELNSSFTASAENHFFSLEVQGALTKVIIDNICRKNIILWNTVMNNLPQILFRFTRKALLQVLPTNSNLAKWKSAANPKCGLCGGPSQTNKHVLANCQAALERFKVRHNNTLLTIANWIHGARPEGSTLCVDIDSNIFQPIDKVFQDTIRPDIVLFDASTVAILELTICHESNLSKSRSYKMNKYANYNHHLNSQFKMHRIKLFTVEVSVLGFISNLAEFCAFSGLPVIPPHIKMNIINTVIRNSFNIYCRRNSKEN